MTMQLRNGEMGQTIIGHVYNKIKVRKWWVILSMLLVTGAQFFKSPILRQIRSSTFSNAWSESIQISTSLGRSGTQLPFTLLGEVRTDYHLPTREWRELSSQAQDFLDQHRQRYVEKGRLQWWQIRHLGYLYEEHQLLLAAILPSKSETNFGRQVVRIFNVWSREDSNDKVKLLSDYPRTDCEKLVLWVRVNGPEIFAGSATAKNATLSSTDCYWEFPFDLQVPGNYKVEVKVLVWNNVVDIFKCKGTEQLDTANKMSLELNNTVQIGRNRNVVSLDSFIHLGFQAFKPYDPIQACCSICTQFQPWCAYWISPALQMQNPSYTKNGCELLFLPNTPTKYLLQSHLIPLRDASDTSKVTSSSLRYPGLNSTNVNGYMGKPFTRPVGYFVGCGWHSWTLDFPCLHGNDDHIFMPSSDFSFYPGSVTASQLQPENSANDKPLCQISDEVQFLLYSNATTNNGSGPAMPKGRWIREPWPSDCGPFEWDKTYTSHFKLTKFNPQKPHCWHRDNFSDLGSRCIEMNCRLIDKSSRWRSSVHEETQWMGVWRNYDCDYLEFNDEQLQQCVNDKQISSITTEGRSIATFLGQYLKSRLKPILMANASDPDAVSVVLSTLRSFHRANEPSDEDLVHYLQQTYPHANKKSIFYWVTSAYLTSERAPNMYVGMPEALDRLSYPVMKQKGFEMFDMHDMSAAFSYDTATQYDGMHIIGPPMKMAITKLFHFLCQDVVEGSRV